MSNQRRKWSTEEKLAIIREVESHGLLKTLRAHRIATTTYYKWKEKYDLNGEAGLNATYQRVDPELKREQIKLLVLCTLCAYIFNELSMGY